MEGMCCTKFLIIDDVKNAPTTVNLKFLSFPASITLSELAAQLYPSNYLPGQRAAAELRMGMHQEDVLIFQTPTLW